MTTNERLTAIEELLNKLSTRLCGVENDMLRIFRQGNFER